MSLTVFNIISIFNLPNGRELKQKLILLVNVSLCAAFPGKAVDGTNESSGKQKGPTGDVMEGPGSRPAQRNSPVGD